MRQLTGKQDGLTLLELIIVMGVSGLLLVGIWRIYHGSIGIYQRGLQDMRSTLAARTTFRIMTRDLQKAFTAARPHGIQGTNNHRTPAEATDALELTLIAFPGRGERSTPAAGTGLPQRVRYALRPKSSDSPQTFTRTLLAADHESNRVIPLSERLVALKLRYFDGQGWYDAWHQAQLPQAVEITAVFRNPGRDAHTHGFSTVVTAH